MCQVTYRQQGKLRDDHVNTKCVGLERKKKKVRNCAISSCKVCVHAFFLSKREVRRKWHMIVFKSCFPIALQFEKDNRAKEYVEIL